MMINLLRNAPQGRERLASIFLVSIEATCVLLPEGSATSSMFEAELRALRARWRRDAVEVLDVDELLKELDL
jgi:hypothetical protein